jgi:hypothetical protein
MEMNGKQGGQPKGSLAGDSAISRSTLERLNQDSAPDMQTQD